MTAGLNDLKVEGNGMATQAKEMVAALEAALKSNVGVKQVTVDGQTITFSDRAAMLAELDYWRREAGKATGKRSMFRSVDIGSAF
jgi:hypothetical protein